MRANYTLTRLYLRDDLTQDAIIFLDKDQTHYLVNVLRLEIGGRLRVFNGRHGEWAAEIVTHRKKGVEIIIREPLRVLHKCPDIWLCFAPVRKHRNSFILEKATELGVSVLQPVITERTQFPKIRLDKGLAQIIEAAEQTERLDLPELRQSLTLDKMLDEWPEQRTLLFADESACEDHDVTGAIQDVLANLSGLAALLIGPEGGFTSQERERLRALHFVKPVSLGPRILRADTAALSLLTLWQAQHGDWSTLGHAP